MFLAIVFILLGLFLLLNAMGIVAGTHFWGFFWAVIFLAIGIKLLMKRGSCPICSGFCWGGKMHEKMHGECCGHDHGDHEHSHDGHDHQ
jgi:hypothetical protein